MAMDYKCMYMYTVHVCCRLRYTCTGTCTLTFAFNNWCGEDKGEPAPTVVESEVLGGELPPQGYVHVPNCFEKVPPFIKRWACLGARCIRC